MITGGKTHQILLTIHGNKKASDPERFIPASVFKSKFGELLSALKEADKTVNDKGSHDYVVSHLKIGSAEFGIQERPRDSVKDAPVSSVTALFQCAEAIYRSNFSAARRYNGVSERLWKLVSGVEETFAYMDFTDPDHGSIQLDGVFKSQVRQLITEKAELADSAKYFRGQAFDSFDCQFLELDFRGRNSRGILVLTGSKVEIPCVFGPLYTESDMKNYLNQRVWVVGNAIYDGSKPLPARIEVASMRNINQTGRPSDWKGALKPFEPSDWESGDDIQQKQ
ncbi:MAG: hypothetical protein R3D32_13650 [Nitratireductor sp.]